LRSALISPMRFSSMRLRVPTSASFSRLVLSIRLPSVSIWPTNFSHCSKKWPSSPRISSDRRASWKFSHVCRINASTARSVSAEHHLAARRVLHDGLVRLVDELVQLLVRDEQQHEVDRASGGVDVVARAQLLDPSPDVPEEVVPEALAIEVRLGLHVAHVVVE